MEEIKRRLYLGFEYHRAQAEVNKQDITALSAAIDFHEKGGHEDGQGDPDAQPS